MTRRGAILVATLWILAILATLTVSIASRVMLDVKLARYHLDRLKAREVAKAGLLRAIEQLRQETNEFDSINEPWATGMDPKTQASVYTAAFGEGQHRVTVVDEQAKIDLNKAPFEVLRRLPEVSDEVAASLIDWRDQDNISTSPGGAEELDYLALEVPYHCKNAPFESLPELLLVREITPAIVKRLEPMVMVYGRPELTQMELNMNTAPPQVLKSLGLSEELIASIERYRAGPDRIWGTADDLVFRDPLAIVPSLAQAIPMSVEEQTQFESELAVLQFWLSPSVTSSRFHVQSQGRVRGVTVTISAVVAKTGVGERPRLLAWHGE